jgi:2,5-diamino-6-(ribosylamino)-4(3H)-pyrimidinone 5'-phosphate reductase
LSLPSGEGQNAGRPYVFMNIVCTVDGRTSVDGKASGLGSPMDRRVMRTLRSKADAVMIGGGTLRAEKLSLGLDAEDPRPQPLAVVLSNTGDVPLERNLIVDRRQRVLLLLAEDAPDGAGPRIGDRAEVRRVETTSGAIDLAKALNTLKADYDVRRLLVEGGPKINHAILSSNLADELFVTLAPTLLGASAQEASSLVGGRLGKRRDLMLLSAYLDADELFLRYAIGGKAQST